jgi:DNA-binding MarR family transcriptional regulator
MSELADASRSSRSRLSHAVSRLEERGWVERQDCETDRRGQLARLTAEGEQALAEAAPGHVAAVRHHVTDQLSAAQIRQLGDIAQALVDGFSATERTG